MNSRRWLVPLGAVSLVVLVASAAGAANLRLFDRVNRADHSTDSPLGRERFDVLDPVTSTDTTAPRVVVTSTSASAEAPAVTTVTTLETTVATADNEPPGSTVPAIDGTDDTDGTVAPDVQDTSVSAPRTTKPRPRPQPPTVPPVNSTQGATAPTPQPTAPPPEDTTAAPGPTRSTPPTSEHRRGGRGSGSGSGSSTSTSTTDPGPDD